MEYSNPEIPEGINAGREHPLQEFVLLVGGILGCIALIVAALSLAAERLVVYVPFAMEEKIAVNPPWPDEKDNSDISGYLQGLSDQLAIHMEIPQDISFHIHYLDHDSENAFAGLGGNIYIFRGLLNLMPNENALAMVIAHEMAHVIHRDPLAAMGRGVVIGMFLMSVAGLSGDYFTGQVVNDAGMITMLTFNRKQERAADRSALAAVAARYGHVAGAADLFIILRKLEQDMPLRPPQFLSTHPVSEERLQELEKYAAENYWLPLGSLTPIPVIFHGTKVN